MSYLVSFSCGINLKTSEFCVPSLNGSRPRRDEAPAPYRSVCYYYCQGFGHTKSTCFKQKRDLAVAHSSGANGGGSGTGKQ